MMTASRSLRLARRLRLSSATVLNDVLSSRFSTSASCHINPLMNLAAFSGAKEAQYLSRERKMPQTEFFPHLELLRSSEVDPFAPVAGASPTVVSALRRAQRGESDTQTAYSLAISNLATQLQASRRDLDMANEEAKVLYDKLQKQERHALAIVLTVVGLFSLLAFKTNVVEDLKEHARSLKSEWTEFDWQWLGNPPTHKKQSSQRRLLELKEVTTPAPAPAPAPVPAQTRSFARSESRRLDISAPRMETYVHDNHRNTTAVATPSIFSRLFWASPSRTE